MRTLRVAVVTNVLPRYRAPFYRFLFGRTDLDVRVFCQRSIPGMNLELAHQEFPDRVTLVGAASMNRERLGWQWLPWWTLLGRFDVLFFLGNVRVLSTVVLATLARALGKPVVIMGQAHTAGSNPRLERIRLWWWRWFDHQFVYTDDEARRLKRNGFDRQYVLGMNNGLDQRRIDQAAAGWDERRLAEWRQAQGLSGREIVLSSARLEPKNAFDVWLTAMPRVIERHPDLLWCVVGEGRERRALESQAERLNLTRHIRWLGALYDEDLLAPWFLSGRLLIHPGAIGLTLLHAFGYGLPVVTHGDRESHMPEFAAFEEGETGFLFRRGDPVSLADQVERSLAHPEAASRMGSRVRQIARERYNVEVMCERFVQIAHHAALGDAVASTPVAP